MEEGAAGPRQMQLLQRQAAVNAPCTRCAVLRRAALKKVIDHDGQRDGQHGQHGHGQEDSARRGRSGQTGSRRGGGDAIRCGGSAAAVAVAVAEAPILDAPWLH